MFIGPPAAAIRAMGDKAEAKRRMAEIGVPTVPGYDGADPDRLIEEGAGLGVPLLVKAVAGGGGRGMRVVRHLDDLPEALASAEREATAAFGDGTLMLEALIEGGRHVEIQVFADAHGAAIHLGERDCTPQRRRQKVVEEAPSPAVDAAKRAQMGADAVRAAMAIGYVGAGTVEWIVDPDGEHFFLEMNTRLQVEHPVTEMVTGVDLVAWQLSVASSGRLPLTQDQVHLDGHAIEARLYAEDPYAGFAPQTGTVHYFRPIRRPSVRLDAGVVEGGVIGPHYDPMIAKVIASGPDRSTATRRLVAALRDMPLIGVRTNRRFLIDLLQSDAFATASLDVGTLDEWAARGDPILTEAGPPDKAWALAAVVIARGGARWYRSAGPVQLALTLVHRGEARSFDLQRGEGGAWTVGAGDAPHEIRILSVDGTTVRYERDRVRRTAVCVAVRGVLYLDVDDRVWDFAEASAYPDPTAGDDPGRIVAAVAGTVVRVDVSVGDRVADGDTVALVEAMKMETRAIATAAATVTAVHVVAGDQVEAGAVIVEVDPEVSDG